MSDTPIDEYADTVRLGKQDISTMTSGDILGLIGPVSAERRLAAGAAVRPPRLGPEAISKMDIGPFVGTVGSMPNAD